MGTGFFVTAPHMLPEHQAGSNIFFSWFVLYTTSLGCKAMELSNSKLKCNDSVRAKCSMCEQTIF